MNNFPPPERPSDEDQANKFSQETHSNQNPIEQPLQGTHLAHPRKEQNLLSNVNARDITVERIVQTTEEHYYPSPLPPAPELRGIPQNLPRGSANFVGRDELLTTLHQELQKSDRAAITAVIAGMGGVGKTEMAVQYAQRYLGDYSGGVCWLQAREGDLETQIIRFVSTILGQQVPVDLSTSGDRLRWCWNYWRSSGTVLLILDDVTDFAPCQNILAELPTRFRVLLTTRQRAIAPYYELPLDVLSEDAALELLMRSVGKAQIEREQQAAKQLCQWLGYLPLGIELVGSYIKEKLSKLSLDSGLPLAKMLHHLTGQYINEETQSLEEAQRAREEALNQIKPGMTAQRGVRSAFELSWQELDSDTAEVAVLVGLFAPSDIPLSLVIKITQRLQRVKNTIVDAIQQLENFYLIQPVELGKRYKVHPLIREFLQEKLEQLETQKHNKLGRAFAIEITKIAQRIPSPDDIETVLRNPKVSLSRQALLEQLGHAMPHLAEVAQNQKWTDLLSDHDWSASFIGLARFYEAQDMYSEAQKWYGRLHKAAQQRLGESRSDIATGLYNQARCYCQLGRYAKAKPLYQKALEIRQSLLGTTHPEVAASLNGLAAAYHAEGHYSDAEPLYQQALKILQQLHGVAHADVMKTLSNLAALYRNQGRFNEAELLYQQLLDQGNMLTQSSLQALRADNFSNRAGLYTSQKRYDEAESLYQQAKEIYQQLGENRPQFADILSNLGRLYLFKQQYGEAEELFIHALEIRQRLPDRNNRDIATCLYNLGNTYQFRKSYEQAEKFYQQALELRRESLGDHPDMVISLTSLLEIYSILNQLNKAESLYREMIDLRKRLQGDHPDVAASLDALVDIYRQQERWKDAEPLLAEALDLRQRLLNHSKVTVNEFARSHYRLALSYFFQGKLPDAQALFERAQQLWQQVPLEEIDAPSFADNLYGISLCYIYTTESLLKQTKDWHNHLYGSSNQITLNIDHILQKHQDVIGAIHNSRSPAPPTQSTSAIRWIITIVFSPIWLLITIIWLIVSKCFELLKKSRKTER